MPQQGRIAEPASGPPGAPARSVAPANPAATTILAAPPSHGIPPSYVCQPMAGYPVTLAGGSVPVAGSAADSLSAGADKYDGASVRLSAGLGYWHTGFSRPQLSGTPAADASGLTGTPITLGFAIGGIARHNFKVFGEVLGSFARDPSVKNSLDKMSTWPGIYGLISIGPGVSYYFDQLNMYASGTLTITRLFGKEIDAKIGWGANLAIGKEWWASTDWRTGVVAVLQYARADDEYRGTSVSLVPSLRLSATWH